MSLALDIVQARINLESKDPTLAEAVEIFKQYEVWPLAFTYKTLRFVTVYNRKSLDRNKKYFDNLIDVLNRDEDDDLDIDPSDFEELENDCKYHGINITVFDSEDDADCIDVLVSDQVVGKPTAKSSPNLYALLAQRIDAAMLTIDKVSNDMPDWVKKPLKIMGTQIDLKLDIDDGKVTVEGRPKNWSSNITTYLYWNHGDSHVIVNITARARGSISNKTIKFKLPVKVAEEGKLPEMIREICKTKNIFQSKDSSNITTVVVDVGDFKETFQVRDATAFKKHLLRYLKGN